MPEQEIWNERYMWDSVIKKLPEELGSICNYLIE